MADRPHGSPNRVALRGATAEDARAIAEVHVDAWRWAYRGQLPDAVLDSLSVEARTARWDDTLRASDGDRVFVAEAEGHIVGWASCGPSRDEEAAPSTGELYGIYLATGWAGRGIGRELMARVVDALSEAGFERATLWVLKGNERARRFYERGGWEPDGAEKIEPHPHEKVMLTEVRYTRSLEGAD